MGRIDWRTLFQADPQLPDKLNRAFGSIEAESLALRRLIADMQTELGDIDVDFELPDVGTPGTYGGGGDFIEALTVDAQGRVTAITTDAPSATGGGGSTEGSIFSMVGPAGAADPIVAYDFTLYDPNLSATPSVNIALNLANANQSGNANLDLTAVGSGQIVSQVNSPAGATSSPFGWTPFASRVTGGNLWCGNHTDYVVTTGSPSEIQFTGAMTVEWLGYHHVTTGGTSDLYLWHMTSATSGTAADNVLYQLYHAGFGVNQWVYRHFTGTGTSNTAILLTTDPTFFVEDQMRNNPIMITLTRSSSGQLHFYYNGRQAEVVGPSLAAATPNALPTGGSNTNLTIGFGSTVARQYILGFRLFDVELTPAQVRASYQRTFFGSSV